MSEEYSDSDHSDKLFEFYDKNGSLLSGEEDENTIDKWRIPNIEEIRMKRDPWKRFALYWLGMPPRSLIRNCTNAENLTEQEIESKFTTLALAFKTDRVTLRNRLELQLRQRDNAEKNIEDEINQLKKILESLSHLCVNCETREIFHRLERQVEVLHNAAERVSSAAELHGAVQQEARISKAIDLVLVHVENVKRAYERDHAELEESRRILAEHNLSIDDGLSVMGDPKPHPARGRSISVMHNGSVSTSSTTTTLSANPLDSPKARRASAATFLSNKSIEKSDVSSLQSPVNKLTRRVGIITSSLRKISNPTGNFLKCQTSTEKIESSPSKTPFSKEIESRSILDESNNNVIKTIVGEPLKSGGSNKSKPKIRSRSLIEPVKEEDESLILEELDDLAKKRDSSPAPPMFKMATRDTIKSSLLKQVLQWYRELYWPWDWEETLLGIRYSMTGILLLAAFVSLIYTFFIAERHSPHNEL